MKLSLNVVGPTVFVFRPKWEEVKENKALLFSWLAQTEVSNIIYWRSLTLRWGWPPIIWVSCFTDTDDAEEDPWERG